MTAPIIPETVRRFMDEVLVLLGDFAVQYSLNVIAYGGAAADSITWQHNYTAVLRGRRISLQVWTDMAYAGCGKGLLQCWIHFSPDPDSNWTSFGQQIIVNKDELIREAVRMIVLLQHNCLLAMPPTSRPPAIA